MGILDFLTKTTAKTDPKSSGALLPDQVYKAAEMELKDIIAPSALGITPKSLNLGTNIVRSYFVISYPRYLTDNWMSPLINLDKIFDVAIHVTPLNTAEVMKGFQRKVAEVESQILTREEKGMIRDPQLDVAYQDLEDLRDGLTQAAEKMYEVSLYITLYGQTEEELTKVETEMKNILESRLVYIKPAIFQQDAGFISTLPLGQDLLGIKNKLNTSPLSSFFPFVSSDLSSDKGILYGLNRHNGSLILFDRFSLENYNSIVFAKSGSGKSYSTKLEILRTLMFDTEVMIIDPEREYEYLAESVGGRYFDISLTSDHHINPFDLPPPTADESASEVLRSNIVNLVGLFRVMLGGLSPEEDAIVDQAITETYALKDITGDTDFTRLEPPLLSDFETVLEGIEGSESLLQRLSKFTRGTWSGFINQPSNVDINKKLVCFSIRDMEDELKPVAMYIITHYIWNAVRKNIKRRILIVDEAWIMMKNEDTASFLFGLAKRGRKYYLGLTTITQDVGDFLKSPYGLPIITNSSIQLLLKQSPSSIDVVQKTFNLTDEEKYLLLESGVGEGIFFAGLKHVAIKIVASYTEDQIITSDPSQLLQIKEMKEEFTTSKQSTKQI
jgi:type IV secretory pathway VirB4 component